MELKNIEKNKTYIIGVSGGPDSMALLDLCVKHKLSVVVAHVNYQKRESAQRDMEIVQDYCKHHGIVYHVLMQNKECTYNFQAFARDIRYDFYRKLCVKYHGEAVLLAHQKDDHIETYLMQKEAKRQSSYYGICDDGMVLGVHVIRPLLAYSKQQLEDYCKDKQVPYGIDESNLSNDYLRNRIRHQIIDHLTDDEKNKYVADIALLNAKCQEEKALIHSFLNEWNGDLDALKTYLPSIQKKIISEFIYEQIHLYVSLKELDQIVNLIQQDTKGWSRILHKEYLLYEEYHKLVIDTCETLEFKDIYEQVEWIQKEYYGIHQEGNSVEALTLYAEDFPICIRNVKKDDVIEMRFGNKKINRWFIDRKIPKKQRKRWPVVTNAAGKVILVPGLGCDKKHFSNNPTCFVVK